MANKKSGGKGNRPRNSGMFVQGNTIGFDTRFKIGNAAASVWDESYPEDIEQYFSDPSAHPYEVIPSKEGWAISKGLSPSTVDKWLAENKYPRFTDSWEKCKALERIFLDNGGLTGALNPSIVKLLLSANHGVTERTAVDANIGNTDSKPFDIKITVVD